eukprot:3895283-Amphidinium_carterae.1
MKTPIPLLPNVQSIWLDMSVPHMAYVGGVDDGNWEHLFFVLLFGVHAEEQWVPEGGLSLVNCFHMHDPSVHRARGALLRIRSKSRELD